MSKINLLGLSLPQLRKLFTEWGQRSYRADQLVNWIYKKRVFNFQNMSNLPAFLRGILTENTIVKLPRFMHKEISQKDRTTKYLFQLDDGEKIETVLMLHREKGQLKRYTLCVSSQVGCPVGCPFCATGRSGFERNLVTAEIVGQLMAVEYEEGIKISNIVFMGMGEPLLNYDHVMCAIKIFTESKQLNLSPRKITVSTSGVAPKIKDLADEGIPLVLAVSLHSPNDKVRNTLVPLNKKYPIQKVIDACNYFILRTGRRVTFEYVLLKGMNDSKDDALKLSKLLRGLLCNVNIIPVNRVEGAASLIPSSSAVQNFVKLLESYGIKCTIRAEKGSDINAACGQLRKQF